MHLGRHTGPVTSSSRDRIVTIARSLAHGLGRSVALVVLTWGAPAIWTVSFVALLNPLGGVPAAAACTFAVMTVCLVVLSRPICTAGRALAGCWSGTQIPGGYRPRVPIARMATGYWWNGFDYQRHRLVSLVQRWIRERTDDPASWRDMFWVLISPFAIGVPAALPLALLTGGVFVLATWAPGPSGAIGAVLAIAAGALLLPFGWRMAEPVTRRVLVPLAVLRLTARISSLVEERADLTQAQEAELHRIERDLHDGPQARLVAIGLSLGAAERMIDIDPDAARALLRETRQTSLAALQELRELVHGIVPPVLLERGLVDAIRALALDTPARVDVRSTLDRALETPIESALYFVTAELLTNAVKHSPGAAIAVTIDRVRDGAAITVTDDGPGGAQPGGGSGLTGIQRRLAAFDGTLNIDSPAGGPTNIRVEVPCGSS